MLELGRGHRGFGEVYFPKGYLLQQRKAKLYALSLLSIATAAALAPALPSV